MDTKNGLFSGVVQFFDSLHISIPGMFAGAAGGFVYLARHTKITAWLVVVCVFSGAVTAAYVAWPLVHYLRMPENYSPAVGFLIGLLGMPITAFLLTAIREVTKIPLIIFQLIPGLRGLVPEKQQQNEQDSEAISGGGDGDMFDSNNTESEEPEAEPEQGRKSKRAARKRNADGAD